MKKLSIVIPVYNEQLFVPSVLEAVCNAKALRMAKEVIVFDDGSTDKSREAIEKFIKSHKQTPITLLTHSRNQGKGASLKQAFTHTTGDVVIVQDGDLEYSPEDYPLLLEPFVKNNADVVYGSRFMGERPHRILYFWNYTANQLLTFLSNMFTNLNLTDMETGYKAFRGNLIREIAPHLVSKRFGFEPEITARIARVPNLKLFEVGISYAGRTYNEGKKITFIDGIRAIGAILRFNLLP